MSNPMISVRLRRIQYRCPPTELPERGLGPERQASLSLSIHDERVGNGECNSTNPASLVVSSLSGRVALIRGE